MSASKDFSFTNFYQNSVMVMEPLEEFLEFEEGFYEQWGKSLLLGTNFFSDPRGNVINIEFEPSLLPQRQFRVVEQLMGFYDQNDVYYVVSLYCGDRYFRMRLFDLDWNEVVYPGRRNNGLACDPLSSVRFFQAFRVQFIPNTEKISFNHPVKLYDPLAKKFEIFVDTDEGGRMETMSLFTGSSRWKALKLIIGEIWRLVVATKLKIFSVEGVEIDYRRDLEAGGSNQVEYLDAKFVKEGLVKGRKNYVLTNGHSQFWNCKIRWTGRSSFECYLTCGWKKYCQENGLVAGDRVRFMVQTDQSNVIQILKI
ncbi:hypothetical protein DEO72_LG11g1195 [Vigna unguiculata]|uniref:TF-B3 domain-containing protein n=1 Tax=Vigna unguiculata TaxID=3917 RepID=A0A4D6NKP1_VIGUN|nr:hypothetical protein DEO72_LG11g1195 [Vigna unguiculata]